MRILFFLLLLFLVLTLVRSRPRRRNTGAQRQPDASAQEMVACAHCGVHVPQSDGVQQAGASGTQYFCSEEHRRLGARNSP
jgi:uncharacterized protein